LKESFPFQILHERRVDEAGTGTSKMMLHPDGFLQ
jgi:hypothetical protein